MSSGPFHLQALSVVPASLSYQAGLGRTIPPFRTVIILPGHLMSSKKDDKIAGSLRLRLLMRMPGIIEPRYYRISQVPRWVDCRARPASLAMTYYAGSCHGEELQQSLPLRRQGKQSRHVSLKTGEMWY